jgi:ribonucleoside-diphosphate reductase alpha chain
MNLHTPFKDPIYQSNLCQEIAIPSNGYDSVKDLYLDSKDAVYDELYQITDEHGNVLTFYPDEEVATQRGIIKIKDLRESDEILHNL